MGFCRDVTEHLGTEERRESFLLHADYPWGTETHSHIEIPYADLPALVKALIRIQLEHCEMDKKAP